MATTEEDLRDLWGDYKGEYEDLQRPSSTIGNKYK